MENEAMKFSDSFIGENILLLRRKLKLSQKEFLQAFFADGQGKPKISAGTFSAIENGKGKAAVQAADMLSKKIGMDCKIFEMHPDIFAKNIDVFLEKKENGFTNILKAPIALKKNTSYTETLVRIISDYLTDGIMCGEIKPGDKLPSDRELAEKFDVGRSTIREALRVISLIGLIEILPGQGSFVASDSSDFFLTPLSWTFLLGKKQASDIIAIRNMLEAGAATLAAQLATEDNLKELQALVEKITASYKVYDFQAFLGMDMDFHLTIAKCSQNLIIYDLLHTARKLLTLISQSGMTTIEHMDQIYEEHMAIYQAILEKDPVKAAACMTDHLQKSNARYSYQDKRY